MRVYEIIWKDTFVDKLVRKHNVQVYEAEEALQGHPVIRKVTRGNVKGEDIYATLYEICYRMHRIARFISWLRGITTGHGETAVCYGITSRECAASL